MKTEKEGEKDCLDASMIQVFRRIVTHHYRNIQPVFLYDGNDIQVCLREKNDQSAYAEKNDQSAYAEKNDQSAYAEKNDQSAYAEKNDQSAYAEKNDQSLYKQKRRWLLSLCASKKNESISLSRQAKKGVGFYHYMRAKN
jgi:hypothetical protein